MTTLHLMPPNAGLEESLDPHLESQLLLDRLARRLDLEDWIVERLRHNERETSCSLPLLREDGRSETCTATAVQHCRAAGQPIATLSFSPSAYLNELRATAQANTHSLALFGLPNGGAAASLVCDVQAMTEREIRRLVRTLAAHADDLFGTRVQTLVPVRDTNDHIIDWLASELADADSQLNVSGASGALAGSLDLLQATGLVELLRDCLRATNRTLASANIAIQGYGPLACALSSALRKHGARVVALADRSGALLNREGLDLAAVDQHVKHHGMLLGYTEAEPACHADVLECDCDALVLLAAPWQVTVRNVERVRAGIVLEAVPHAVTQSACEVLEGADRTRVVPAVLCDGVRLCAGALQSRQSGLPASRKAYEAVVRRAVRRVMYEVAEAHERRRGSFRLSAEILALDRCAASIRAHSPSL